MHGRYEEKLRNIRSHQPRLRATKPAPAERDREVKLLRSDSLPHYSVYGRIRPSSLGGVGVFAIKNIKKGADIFGEDDDEIVWIERSQLRGLPREVRRL